jgi:hypothetical protein
VIGGDSAAVLVRYEAVNGVQFEGCYFLEVESGLITRIRTVFDSRPLMTGDRSAAAHYAPGSEGADSQLV